MASSPPIPQAFVWRRLHSLTGIFLVLFLISHLFTNSQAALWIGDDGSGFVKAVNGIHNLPYLSLIEIGLLAVPILIHALWGIKYLRTGEMDSFTTDGTTPSLPEYSRNKAYSWQRITSYILLIAILAHVVQMRFMEYPTSAKIDNQEVYMLPVSLDQGLITLAHRLDVRLLSSKMIEYEKKNVPTLSNASASRVGELLHSLPGLFTPADPKTEISKMLQEQHQEWVKAAEARPLKEGEVLAIAPDFGTIELLLVRDTFKSPVMIALYTLFVLAACFHAFNGLWTSMITWGVTISESSQRAMLRFSTALMVIIAFLGLAAIWGTYWLNLNQ